MKQKCYSRKQVQGFLNRLEKDSPDILEWVLSVLRKGTEIAEESNGHLRREIELIKELKESYEKYTKLNDRFTDHFHEENDYYAERLLREREPYNVVNC